MQGRRTYSPESQPRSTHFPIPDALNATPRTLIGQFLETPAHLREEDEDWVEQDENWEPPQRHLLSSKLALGDTQRSESESVEADTATDLKVTAIRLMDNQRRIDELERQKRDMHKQLRIEAGKSSEYQKQISDLTTENKKLVEAEADLRATLQTAEELVQKHEAARAGLVKEKAALAAELTGIRETLDRKEKELGKYKEKTGEVKDRLRTTQDTLRLREQTSEEIEDSHQKQVSEYERQQLHELEETQQQVLDTRRRLDAAHSEIKELERELATERLHTQSCLREKAALRERMETMGVTVPRYEILPWLLAFFIGFVVSYVPLGRIAGSFPVVG